MNILVAITHNIFSKKRKSLCIILFVALYWFFVAPNINYNLGNLFNPNLGYVNRSKDLSKVNINSIFRLQKFQHNGVNEKIRNAKFVKKHQIGYVSDVKKTRAKKGMEYSDVQLNGIENNGITCLDLQYNNTLEYLVNNEILQVDLKKMRRSLVYESNPNLAAFVRDNEKDMSEDEILRKRWYAFGSAAVWLENHDCYVTYTRIIYSIYDNREFSFSSVVAAQVYDADWNEIIDKRIPFNDVEIPVDVQQNVVALKKQLINYCSHLENHVDHENCITDSTENRSALQSKIDTILDQYSIKYPQVLQIPFELLDEWNGQEDPHVILRKDTTIEEPVIIYNTGFGKDGRRMQGFFPHRKDNNLVDFVFDESEGDTRAREKNWAPFFYPGDISSSTEDNPLGYIHFIYDFNPLEILRCSLSSGVCKFVFNSAMLGIERGDSSALRGATQYVPLPDILPQVKGKKMWLGFGKTHIDKCGCGSRFYRPVLNLLIEQDGIYHLELISPNIDFDIDVLGWSLKDTDCGGYNVLSPSSISNWAVVGQDPNTLEYEDYLTLTFSEADAVSKSVVIRGVVNYILGIYKQKNISDKFKLNKHMKGAIKKLSYCISKAAETECRAYGITHPELSEETN